MKLAARAEVTLTICEINQACIEFDAYGNCITVYHPITIVYGSVELPTAHPVPWCGSSHFLEESK